MWMRLDLGGIHNVTASDFGRIRIGRIAGIGLCHRHPQGRCRVHLYSDTVQQRCIELGLTTKERIRRKAIVLKIVCLSIYIAYVWLCVYTLNGASGFLTVFWQCFVILSVMNLIDRLGIDEYWVGHTKAWVIPGTEDLMPYISKADKQKKWLFGTVGMAVISLILAAIGLLR